MDIFSAKTTMADKILQLCVLHYTSDQKNQDTVWILGNTSGLLQKSSPLCISGLNIKQRYVVMADVVRYCLDAEFWNSKEGNLLISIILTMSNYDDYYNASSAKKYVSNAEYFF